MLYYTKSAYDIFSKKMRLYSLLLTLLAALAGCGYYIYAAVVGLGFVVIDIVLASISGAYAIFLIATAKLSIRLAKKVVKKSYIIAALAIRGLALGFNLYGFYVASSAVNPIAIIITTIMLILWVIQFVVELACDILWPKVRLLIAGAMKDAEPAVKVINKGLDLNGSDQIELPLEDFQKEIDIIEPGATILRSEARARRRARREARRRRILDFFFKPHDEDE